MVKRGNIPHLILAVGIALVLLAGNGSIHGTAADELRSSDRGVIVIAQKIRPYLAALEGITTLLDRHSVPSDIFFLSDFPETQHETLTESLRKLPAAFYLAVGPEAAVFLKQQDFVAHRPLIATMLLNPENILGETACGVFLNIPIDTQLRTISKMLPTAKRIGIIHNPQHNAAFITHASTFARSQDQEIVPLPLFSRNELATLLEKNWDRFDTLWFIPDATVISENIVEYINKQAFLHQRPTIGYNSFFYETGSLISFTFDYARLGSQAAAVALDAVRLGVCRNEAPAFQTLINTNIAERLHLQISPEMPPERKEQ